MQSLIVVPRYCLTNKIDYSYNFPLGLGYISSVLKQKGYAVDCINLNHFNGTIHEILSKKLDGKKYDLVCSGHTGIGYAVIEKITNTCRSHPSMPRVILGGPLITSEPELMIKSLKPDVAVIGEGEITIVELFDALEKGKDLRKVDGIGYEENGKLIITKPREVIKGLDSLPFPDFDGFDFSTYLDNLGSQAVYGLSDAPREYPILASRGCPFQCTFCLSGDTLILMADGTSRKLRDIKIGDKIIGIKEGNPLLRAKCCISEVKNKWKTKKKAVKIEMTNGNILFCSEDHRFLSDRGWKYAFGKIYGKMKRPHLTSNNFLRGIPQIYETPKLTDTYKKGYLAGVIEGDGHVHYFKADNGTGKIYDRFSFRLAMKDCEAILRAKEFLNHFGIEVNKFKMDFAGNKVDAIRKNSLQMFPKLKKVMIHKQSNEYFRGYLAGIFDAEGSFSSNVIRIKNKDKEIISFICKALDCFKFKYVVEDLGVIFSVRVQGGISEFLRFFQITNPAISRKGINLIGRQIRYNIGIKKIVVTNDEKELYDITTSTGNFIANGIISHNCYHSLGEKYRQRSIDNVIKELEWAIEKYKINLINIYDDLFSVNKERLYNFCSRLKGLITKYHQNIKWTCNLSVAHVDKEMLLTLKDSGCEVVCFGLESYSPEVLKSMKKPITPEQIDNALHLAREVGICIQGNFIFGDIAETKETAETTLDYWKKNSKGQILIGFIQPYPGSRIYKHCIEKGIIKDKLDFIKNHMHHTNWLNMTENMTDEEVLWLKKEILTARKEYAKYVTPIRVRKVSKEKYNIAVRCPYCEEIMEYKNWAIKNVFYHRGIRICKHCGFRFFIVSPLYKFTVSYYQKLDFFRRTYLSLRDRLLKERM